MLESLIKNIEFNDINTDIDSKSIYTKPFKCRHCNLNYTFEYLIQTNTVNESCKYHPGRFLNEKWDCCSSGYENLGCLKQCHDIQHHCVNAKLLGLSYVTFEFGTYILHVPMSIWLKIMKKRLLFFIKLSR